MLELIKRARILMLVSVAALSAFIFFFIYSPMMSELQNTMYLNVAEVSMSKYSSVQNAVQGAVMGSVSLSSRSAIRDKTADYKNGNVSLDDLVSFTQPKYVDGASVLDNVVFAQRIVDGQAIASYEEPGFNRTGLENTVGYNHIVSREFFSLDGKLYMKIFSPVKLDGKELGFDLVLFDFTNKLLTQNDPTFSVRIIDMDEFDSVAEGAEVLIRQDDSVLLGKNKVIYFSKAIDGHYFLVQANRKTIFSNATSLTIRIAVSWMAVFVGFLLAVYFYIVRYANKSLKNAEQSRDLFKDMAYTDRLTGLFSRSYLEKWKTTLREIHKKYGLVIIDIDDFKRINDQFGHLAGDELLKKVADILLSSVRENDIIVRFGGDEFLLILGNADAAQSQNLMDRIKTKLAQIEGFGFAISVSFGISQLEMDTNFNSALKQADEKMYAFKNGAGQT